MKKLALLFVFVLFMLSARSQDTIVFKDASEIEAKVTDITIETISYVKWNNPDGPKYTVNKSEIFYVKYQCGDKDVFSDVRTKSAPKNLRTSADKFRFDGIRLQSYVYGGAIFMSHAGGPAVDLSLGVRLWDYAYVGVETGFHSLFSSVYYSDKEAYSVRHQSERLYSDQQKDISLRELLAWRILRIDGLGRIQRILLSGRSGNRRKAFFVRYRIQRSCKIRHCKLRIREIRCPSRQVVGFLVRRVQK